MPVPEEIPSWYATSTEVRNGLRKCVYQEEASFWYTTLWSHQWVVS